MRPVVLVEHPVALLSVLAAVVAGLLRAEKSAALAPVFRRLPAVFWIYALPMALTALGVIPASSPLYSAMTRYLLPASLVLVLLSSDLKAIAALGPRALGAMAASCGGIALGAVVAFLLLGESLGGEAWKVFAALSGTWTGGSANLLAVSAALGMSPEAQGVAILVDTVVGYSWMGILIGLSARQAALDRGLRGDRGEVEAVGRRVRERVEKDRRPTSVMDAAVLLALALAVSTIAMALGRKLPAVGEVLTPFSWGILITTSLALAASLTPLARLDGAGASSLGYAAFYLLLSSVGAQADARQIVERPLWVAAGVVIIAVHAAVLLLALRVLRAPSFYFGAASQAAVGGVASAPVVAEVYQQGLAPVGLLLAIVGGVVGTYLGLGVGQLLRSLG